MATLWATQQRQGWLSFGTQVNRSVDVTGQEVEKRSLDPADYQWLLVQVLEDLLESKIDPQVAAERVADLILSYSNIETAWNNFFGCLFSAVEEFSDDADLTKLTDLLASLATLSNVGSETQTTTQSEGEQQLKNDRCLANLPYFALNLRERMNGPEAYLSEGQPPETAKYRWRNINTFTAMFTHAYGKNIPALSYHLNFALWTLALALEYPPETKIGKNISLHLPAAIQWILIATDEIKNATGQNQRATPGPLWKARGGTEQFDKDRWLFWQHRLVTLAELNTLDDDTKGATKKARDNLAALTSK